MALMVPGPLPAMAVDGGSDAPPDPDARPADLAMPRDAPAIAPIRCTGAQFVENLGQAGEAGGALYLRSRGASIAFLANRVTVALGDGRMAGGGRPSVYDIVFEGANDVAPEGTSPTGTEHNYFLGVDPAKWVTGARGFSQVRYASLWDGIDLIYRLADGALKYDILVAPWADPGSIRMRYSGADGIRLDASGALEVATAAGTCRDGKPVSFQQGPTGSVPVESAFALLGPTTVGFEVCDRDPSRPLVIDPVLVFGTFVGGSVYDSFDAVAVDEDGNIILAGFTNSPDFPTTGDALDGTLGGNSDVVLCKLAPDGASLLYSTLLGGPATEHCYGLEIGPDGAIYLTGISTGEGFPVTAGAYDTSHNGLDDAFVVRLNATGRALDFSTYFGGASGDRAYGISVDDAGEVVVAGETRGAIPTTAGALQGSYGGGNYDAFAFRLNATGQGLIWSSFAGGRGDDVCRDVALDGQGNAYLVGSTASGNFPIGSGGYDTSHGQGDDMFVLRLGARDGARLNATYLGTNQNDYLNGVVISPDGGVHVTGNAYGSGLPTSPDAYDRYANGNSDIYVCELDAELRSIIDATYVGAFENDWANSLWVDPSGCTHVVGATMCIDFPLTPDALSTTLAGNMDVCYIKLSADASTLLYSTYLGGTGISEVAEDVVYDGQQRVYIVGYTYSADFPTTAGALDVELDGSYDAFVVRIRYELPPRWLELPQMHAVEDVPLTVDLATYIEDPDTPQDALRLSSPSTYVTGLSGLNATVLFPEGILEERVPLVLYDGIFEAIANLNFTIESVNDPPVCTISTEHIVTEDGICYINFTNWVSDADNATSDLFLVVDSPYASSEGLLLAIRITEEILSCDLSLNVSDGIDMTEVHLHLTVTPHDDPPVVGALPPFTAVEDQDSVFDLGPYLSDVDTPISQLRFRVSSEHCTGDGQTLHFLFPLGDVDVKVGIDVLDAGNLVHVVLSVHVQGMNDPPVILPMLPRMVIEDKATAVDLSEYITDEDTPRDLLTLECQDPHLAGLIVGLNLTLLYTTWEQGLTVAFSVTDGVAWADGSFDVEVQPVNDPPVLLGLDELRPPITILVDEGEELYLQVLATDEEGSALTYELTGGWSGATALPNGTVRIAAQRGNVGNRTAMLVVRDPDGGEASLPLAITVRNVNDPPDVPVIRAPRNYTVVEEGTNVTFSVEVFDPDMALGQVLTVTWASNVSGLLMTLTSNGALSFVTDALTVGPHRITVTVTDGQYSREAYIKLTVTARPVPPSPDDGGSSRAALIAAITVIIVLVVVGALLLVAKARKGAMEEVGQAPPAVAATPPAAPAKAPAAAKLVMEGDLARATSDVSSAGDRLEAERRAEGVATTVGPVGPAPEAPVPITEEDRAERARARELREVRRALTQLPQGLPSSLASWDIDELARAFTEGEARTAPDGTPLVKLGGAWYNADRTDPGAFAREWRGAGPAAAAGSRSEAGDVARLEKLESALLDGRVSEETYRELKRKYEGKG